MERGMECMRSWIDTGSVESRRYYESRRTALEMLSDRGYDVVQHSNLTPSLAEFRSRFGQLPNPQSLAFCVSHLSNPSNMVRISYLFAHVQVVFADTHAIKKETVADIYNQIVDRENLKGLVLIVQSQMTSSARKYLQSCPFPVEIIRIDDMLVNISKHVLQPKYEVLTDDEKKALLMKYNIEEKQLPLMLKSDPIARYYKLEKGQVIKITHSGGVVDSHVSYRCVV
ncbi:DNA-directed RNA polymerase V subunit 5A, partial [Mucuna pruriens]